MSPVGQEKRGSENDWIRGEKERINCVHDFTSRCKCNYSCTVRKESIVRSTGLDLAIASHTQYLRKHFALQSACLSSSLSASRHILLEKKNKNTPKHIEWTRKVGGQGNNRPHRMPLSFYSSEMKWNDLFLFFFLPPPPSHPSHPPLLFYCLVYKCRHFNCSICPFRLSSLKKTDTKRGETAR